MDAPINNEGTMISNSFRREIRRIIIESALQQFFTFCLDFFQPVNAPPTDSGSRCERAGSSKLVFIEES